MHCYRSWVGELRILLGRYANSLGQLSRKIRKQWSRVKWRGPLIGHLESCQGTCSRCCQNHVVIIKTNSIVKLNLFGSSISHDSSISQSMLCHYQPNNKPTETPINPSRDNWTGLWPPNDFLASWLQTNKAGPVGNKWIGSWAGKVNNKQSDILIDMN